MRGVVSFGRVARAVPRSFDAHAGLCAVVGSEQENAGTVARCGEHHALGQAEFHLARRQVGDHRRQAADQVFRAIRRLDAGEHGARPIVADVERELEQFVGAVDVLGVDDSRDAQIDLVEFVD